MTMGKSLTIEERKQIGLEILDEIQRVCKILDIKFYLAYGTLLGAIRHKGYIPWDDDIDIWVFRKDYEILKKEFNNLCKPEYKLWTYDNRDDYPYLMTKIVCLKTEIREKYFKDLSDFGLWVDVFTLDYISPKTKAAIPQMVKLEHRRWCALFKQSTIFAKIKLFFYNLIQNDTSFKDFSIKPRVLTKEIHRLHSCTEKFDKISSPASERSLKSFFFDASDFDKTLYVPFEDRIYPVPEGYDDLLKTVYGNYMEYPPIAQRKLDKHFMKIKWK